MGDELGLSRAIVESVGVEVLSDLREKLNAPSEIAYELPKLGTFAMHLAKYTSFHKFLLGALESGRYTLGEDYSPEMYEKNKILMTKIDQFYAEKATKKQAKDEKKTRESCESQS